MHLWRHRSCPKYSAGADEKKFNLRLQSNQKLCAFTGLSPARLRNGRLAIYEVGCTCSAKVRGGYPLILLSCVQLLSPQSFVGYWEAYAKGVVPALQSSQRFEVALEVAVRKDQLGLLPSTDGLYSLCTLNCSVSFDPYGLPVSKK